MSVKLRPLNDCVFKIKLWRVTEAGARVPLTTGTTTAFLSLSNALTSTAADPTLTATVTYTGSNGWWLVSFDAAVLTVSLLNSLFASVTPYTIVKQVGAVATAVEMEYSATNDATIAD